MITLSTEVRSITKIWRGARGSADMMNGIGALTIRTNNGENIEIAGTPEELDILKASLIAALEAEAW